MFDLELFLTIVQRGNFSRAAESLALTQPALSQRVKQLEAELGYPLLIRGKGCQAIVLTERGNAFVPIARQMLSLWRDAKGIGDGDVKRERLRISIIDSVMTCTIPEVVHDFTQEYPEVEVTVNNYHSLESYRHIEDNDIDIAVVGKLSHARGAINYPIYSDPWVFVCGKEAHYPETVHPTELDTGRQLLLCNTEVDDWQEYWFYGENTGRPQGNKISYVNKYLFEGETWAVLPLSIARYLRQSANGEFRTIREGPAPRIVYMVQSNRADPNAVRKFKACVYRNLRKVQGIRLLFEPEGQES